MKTICKKCIGDLHLRNYLKIHGFRRVKCSYCGNYNLGTSIKRLAECIYEILKKFICLGGFLPSTINEREINFQTQNGYPLNYTLEDELSIRLDAANELALELIKLDPARPGKGKEPFFSEQNQYERCEFRYTEYQDYWVDFSESIKHNGRFFDPLIKEYLEEILGRPGDPGFELPFREFSPVGEAPFYRARKAESDEEATKTLQNPHKELGPPPQEKVVAGRMNPTGIPVFYGALSGDTAIAEVRPSVGGIVLVGQFKPIRNLKLLDFTKIGKGQTLSIFDVDYKRKMEHIKFLRKFHGLISRPIQPHEEALEYLPTQAVAEYIYKVLGFEGILYKSAQTGTITGDEEEIDLEEDSGLDHNDLNVVIFGREPLIDGSDINEEFLLNPSLCLAFEEKSCKAVYIESIFYNHKPYDSNKNDFFRIIPLT